MDIHEWSGADSLLVLGENELVLPPEVGSVVGQHETLVQVLPEVSCKRKQNILTTANVRSDEALGDHNFTHQRLRMFRSWCR